MKTTSSIVVAGMLALLGAAQAEEGQAKPKKEPKPIAPEILEKYDTNKDGKLDKDEKAAMKKAQAAEPKPEKAKKEPKPIDPAILEKYDTDKDGKLNKEEKAAMNKDKAKEPKPEKVAKPKKPKKVEQAPKEDF